MGRVREVPGLVSLQYSSFDDLALGMAASDRFSALYFRQRPYCVEYTRSHLNSEVKQRKARSVLGWGTAWEALRVLLAFSLHE